MSLASLERARALIPPEWAQWMRRLKAERDWRSRQDPPLAAIDGAPWVDALPSRLDALLSQWDLSPTGSVHTGWTAIVVPVVRDGEPLALKVVWPHPEAVSEHLALRRWDGDGAVRLIAADPGQGGLLLERLDADTDLRTVPIDEACATLGSLLGRLQVPALPRTPRLSDFLRHELDKLLASPAVLPRRYFDQASSLIREALTDPACDATLIHTDLHYENVLAASREPWLAIDPKPLAGHPGFDLHPALFNRDEDLRAAPNMRRAILRRLDIICERAGIDVDSARRWTIINAALHALWDADEDDQDSGIHVAVIKAMND